MKVECEGYRLYNAYYYRSSSREPIECIVLCENESTALGAALEEYPDTQSGYWKVREIEFPEKRILNINDI